MIRLATLACVVLTVITPLDAKRSKTPKSQNARALAETHKDYRKHVGRKGNTYRAGKQ